MSLSALLKKVSLCLLLSAMFGLFGLQNAAAQEALLRVVAVSGEDGSPLVAANVLMYRQGEEELRYNCVTNNDGFCEIRNIEPGMEYELRITYVGFARFRQNVSLEAGERETIRVELPPEMGEFDEITVRGERVLTTGEVGVRRIGSVDIGRIPTPGVDGDLVSYLSSEPGVVSTGDRGGDLFIRGGTPDQNQILVDNLPIVKPFHISNLFSAFSEDIVQTADMYAGGYGAEYSGATSAVIDIKLRPGNMKNFAASGAVSPYMVSLHMEGPIKTDGQSFLLTGRRSVIEDVSPTLIGEEIPLQFSDIVGRYTIQGDNISCNITGIRTNDSGEIVPGQELRHSWSNNVLGARCLAFDTGFNHPLEMTAGYSGYQNSEGAGGDNERFSSLNQFYMNLNLQELILGIPVNYGFGVNFRNFNIDLQEKFISQRSINRIIPVISLFTLASWEPNNRWAVQPGVASQISLDSPTSLEPRLRIAWKPDGTDQQELSLAAGRYVQLTTGVSDQRDVGTVFTVLQPVETGDPLPSSLHGILAYQQRLGNFFVANVEGYVKDYKNIQVSKWTPENRIELETALADGFTYGFDLRFRYFKNPFFISAGYGWSFVEYEATSGNLGAWIEEPVFEFYPAHDQRHKLNTVLGYKFADFEGNIRWELGSGKPYTRIFGFDMSVRVPMEDVTETPGIPRILFSRPFGERMPYYHRLDVSVNRSFSLSQGWTVKAETGVINAYNRNNIFNFDFNTLQRVDQGPLFPYLSVKISRL